MNCWLLDISDMTRILGPVTRTIPRHHSWKVECREPGFTVDEHVAKVRSRVTPQVHKIAELDHDVEKENPPIGAWLQVVRYFSDDEGESEEPAETIFAESEIELERNSGQHQLMGWHLRQESFLQTVGAGLDVDEYG